MRSTGVMRCTVMQKRTLPLSLPIVSLLAIFTISFTLIVLLHWSWNDSVQKYLTLEYAIEGLESDLTDVRLWMKERERVDIFPEEPYTLPNQHASFTAYITQAEDILTTLQERSYLQSLKAIDVQVTELYQKSQRTDKHYDPDEIDHDFTIVMASLKRLEMQVRQQINDILRNKDSYFIWSIASFSLILTALFIILFVTRRRQLRSESQYRHIIESLRHHYIFYRYNTSGIFTYVSESVYTILGYTPDEFLNYFTQYLTEAPINQKVQKHTKNSLLGLQQAPFLMELYHKDGSIYTFEVTEHPTFDEQGEIIGVEGLIKDVTNKIRRDGLINNSQTILFYWKAQEEWPVEQVSENIRLFGYTSDDFLSGDIKFADIIHPEDIEKVADEVRTFTQEHTDSFVQIYRIFTADGEVRWIDDRTVIERDAEGRPIYYLGTIIDITEQKAVEERLLQQQRLLMEQAKMAQMGSMLSNIAHQWKQPLARINAKLIELPTILRLKQPKEVILEEHLEQIEELTSYMANTIENFRTYFHPDKATTYFMLKQTIEKAISLCDLKENIKGLEITIACSDDIMIHGHENELIQVLIILLINAKEAMEDAAIATASIKITVHKSADSVNIRVTDNGGGIEEAVADKMFTPYFSTKDQSQNSGLGLYMAKMIIESGMQGSLRYDHFDGESHFTIGLKG